MLASLTIIGRSVAEGIGWRNEARGRKAGLGISAFGSAEEEDVRFGAVELVMYPAARLLNSDCSPFLDRISVTDSVSNLLLGIFL